MKRLLATAGTLLLTGALGVVLPTVAAPIAGAEIACGYAATSVANFPIEDATTTTSLSEVPAGTRRDPILDLDVIVNITHTHVQDLVITLSYGGESVTLVERQGSSGDNFTGTRFNDGAALDIASGAAPFTGQFRPEQSLNAFDGLDPGGFWTLKVRDVAEGDVGTLDNWTLILNTEWCSDPDRDRIKSPNDLCPEVKGVQPHGCPVRARTVTILYRSTPKEFRGKLTCAADAQCHVGQPVRIYKVRSGKDAVVGRGFTNATGNYAIPKASVGGRYYAVAPTVVEEGVAECARAESAKLTL